MKNLNPIKLFRWLSILLALSTIIISIQNYSLREKRVGDSDILYTEYNNFKIFKHSFFHLLENKNLYEYHEEEHFDLYKYSPTFALFMGIFAYFPDVVGLILWGLLNAFVLISAIKHLPLDSFKKNAFILAFIFIELITSLQNSQSNALMVGLILWAFILLERKKILYATLLITLSVFIKLFGLVAFALFIFYPNKGKAVLSTLVWALLLFALPLIVLSFPELIQQYDFWLELLKNDKSVALDLSVNGWLNTWFGISGIRPFVLISGSLLLLAPLIKVSNYSSTIFRYLFLSSLLIWMVIFNHKAESPTFIIAISGVAIWYFTQEKSKLNLVLLLFVFVFSILSPTELMPSIIDDELVIPYVLKAVPCIFVWFKLNYDLWTIRE